MTIFIGNTTFNNLEILAGNTATFASSGGFVVTGSFNAIGSSGTEIVMSATTAGQRALFRIGSSQNVQYVVATDIDSSIGVPVTDMAGTTSNTINWLLTGTAVNYIWTGSGANASALLSSNWSVLATPTGGNSVYFTDVGTGNCTWDILDSMLLLTINSSYAGTVTTTTRMDVTNALTVQGNLTVGAGGLNAASVDASDATAKTISMGNGTWLVRGNVSLNGSSLTLNRNGSTLIMNANGNLNASANTLNIVSISNGTTTLAGNLNIDNKLNVYSTLILGVNTLTITGSLNNAGSISVDGSMVKGYGSSLTLVGNTTFNRIELVNNTTSNWGAGNSFVFAGSFNALGTDTEGVVIRSTVSSTSAKFLATLAQNIGYVLVSDNDASGGAIMAASAGSLTRTVNWYLNGTGIVVTTVSDIFFELFE